MTGRTDALASIRILVLEDDYYLATDLQQVLEAAGATVIGPFGDEAQAAYALAELKPSCAFVDVNLGDGPSFDLPRQLLGSKVPFAFVTGYDAGTIPQAFAAVPRLEKPIDAKIVVDMAMRLLRPEDLSG
jgi:DNA-binding response OmpR family regulator